MKQSYLKYILGLLILGSNGVIAAQIHMNSYEIVLVRTFLGSLFLAALLLLSKSKLQCLHHKKELFFMLLSGIAMGLNWLFLFEGYATVGVSITILLCYCGPIFVMLVSPIFFRERITLTKIVCFAIVIFGMLCINGQSLEAGKSPWGIFCGVMAAVIYAVMIIANKKAPHIRGMENATIQIATAFFTVLIFVLAKQGLHLNIRSSDLLPILLLGFINSGIAIYLYFSPIDYLPVQSVAIIGYSEPLSAVIFSVLFLGEKLLPLYIIGGICIIGGALLAELYKPKGKSSAHIEKDL